MNESFQAVVALYISIISIYIPVINILTFLVFGFDKWMARGNSRRTPEKVLLGMMLIGGIVGGVLGMSFFRHKTRKSSFQLWVSLIGLLYVGITFLHYYVLFYK